jgi:hypothetical protein
VVVFMKRSGLDGNVYLWLGVECRGCLSLCLFLGVPPIYDAFGLYSLIYQSLLVTAQV